MPSNRFKLDNRLTALMVEDFQHDPILAAKVLLQLKVPPHEQLRLMWMWSTYFTIDDSGFSTGKSFTFAIVSALRSILFKDRVSGVISKTFAQGKLIFQNYDRWYDNCSIFRNCIKMGSGGKPRLVHGTDVWIAEFKSGSTIRVLPPDFMRDSERLKSERFHDAYLDEYTSFGNFEALNKIIVGRVTKENHYPNCPVKSNHIHLSSTPNFTHHPSYEIIKRTNFQIAQGNKSYGRFSCNYRHIPKTEEWQWLVNRRTIFQLQVSLPANIIKSEVDGVWTEDSGTWYSSYSVDNARSGNCTYVPRRETADEIFLAAADIARSNRISKRQRSGDDFAMSVLRMANKNATPHHCFTIRKSGVTAEQMSGIIHKYHLIYGFRYLGIDVLGGGLFVLDELKKNTQLIDNERIICTPLVEVDDYTNHYLGQKIIVPIRRSCMFIEKMWGKMQSDSILVNRMHTEMKKAIENRELVLASDWSGWESDKSDWDVHAKREWLNLNSGLSPAERTKAEMDLAVCQLVLVDIERDRNGVPQIDSHGMYKFSSKQKKDAAYSILYAKLMHLIYKYSLTNSLPGINEGKSSLLTFASSAI